MGHCKVRCFTEKPRLRCGFCSIHLEIQLCFYSPALELHSLCHLSLGIWRVLHPAQSDCLCVQCSEAALLWGTGVPQGAQFLCQIPEAEMADGHTSTFYTLPEACGPSPCPNCFLEPTKQPLPPPFFFLFDTVWQLDLNSSENKLV